MASTLTVSLRIQGRVIGALLLREVITRYGRHNLGFAWTFLEPMLFTLGITALWAGTRELHQSSLSIVAFAVTGYSSVLLWRNCANRCSQALEPNLSLLYHRNVRVVDIFVARLLLEIAGATASFILLSMLFIVLGWMQPPQDALMVTAGWLLLSWFGAALGILIGALAAHSELVDRLWHTMAYLLFPLSGAVYLVDWLPPAWRDVALWLPMVNGVEMLRDGWFGSTIRAHYDIAYLLVSCLVLSTLAMALVGQAARKVQPQ
jgi:capsular polysaccharide transport system permease protein